MKNFLLAAVLGVSLMSCGNATDGDARTDTTDMMVDTGNMTSPDTANHTVTSTGKYPNDTLTQHNVKGDKRSSQPTSPEHRSTTPNSNRQHQNY